MGFGDTMKGLGRAVGGFLESALQMAGPPLIQAGTQILVQKMTGGQAGQYQPRYGTLPTPAYAGGYDAPRGYSPAPAYRPAPSAPVPYAPAGRLPVPQSWQPIERGGYAPAPAYGGGYQPSAWEMPSIVGPALDFFTGGTSMPAVTVPGTSGGGMGTELMERLRGAVGGQTTMYRYGGERVTPVREIQAVNPVSGKIGIWRYMGHPILYSGDLATCKRVGRIARRVARRRPR